MKIFVLGMPGSGKTTLGKALASILQLRFVDLDGEIEKKEGASIPEIFRHSGESRFRDLERKMLAHTIESLDDFVMATGGGTPCFHDNLEKMQKAGVTVFLDVPLDLLMDRLRSVDPDQRPLLAGGPETMAGRLSALWKEREQFYRQARLQVNGLTTPADLASLIRTAVKD